MKYNKIEYTSDTIKPHTSKHTVNIISNCHVKIERYQCRFCKILGGRTPPSFTSTWSAIWHMCHTHKDEAEFEKEFETLKKLAKVNGAGQMKEI